MNSKLINEFDEILLWPKKRIDKDYVVKFLSTKFDVDKNYSEQEVNEVVNRHHKFNDTPLLRRELISRKMLSRTDDGSIYWKNKIDSI